MGGTLAGRRFFGITLAAAIGGIHARWSGRKILAAVLVTAGVVVVPALPASAAGVDANSKTASWAQSGSGVVLIDGQLVTYSLNANRDSSPDTAGVTISDTLPVGLDYVSSDGPGAVGAGTFNAGTRVVSWTNQTLTSADQIWTIVARVNLAANANIANSFTVSGDGDTDSASVTTNGVLNVVPNPDLPAACRALKVTLVLDSSGSIDDAGAVATVRTAARDFLTALSGTGSQANVVSFSTSADTLLGTMTTITPAALANGGALDNALDGYYTTGSFDGWTNWEDGLREALGLYDSNYTGAGGVTASQVPDLVVFVTDGAPTTFIGGPTGTDTVNIANSRNAAIDEANFIKSTVVSGSQNVKILGLGVGQISTQQLFLDNFLAISGDGLGQGQQATAVTTANLPTLDLLTSDFSGLSQALKDLVTSLCSNSVTITKQVQDPATGLYSVADGWEMEGNLTFVPAGQSFAWVSPATVAPNNGRKGNTSSPAGQPNTLGNVVFQWTTTGIPTTQTFAFKENPTAGQNQNYSFDSVTCFNGASPVTVTTVNGFFTVTVPYKAALNCTIKNKFNFSPAINVDKTANPTTILVNGNTTYTYVVTNTGNVPLSSIQLTDNRFTNACLSTPVKTGGDLDAVLELGETWTYTCVRSLSQGTTNTATVIGTPAVGPNVSDTDDATVTVIAPAINVAKTANPNVIYVGNTVTYTFVVTNVGTNPGGAGKPPLSNVTVSDPNCLTISAPVKTGGDQDSSLEDAEVWTYTCTKAVSADVTNTVTATGTPAVGPNVSDTDTAVVNVISPAIDIVKTASAPTVHSGDSVTYTFKVTNVGDDPLSNIVVLDDKCSPLSAPVKTGGDADALLETGELWTYTCARAISATDTNTATATGTDSKGGTVTDTSSVTVNVITPAIDITKAVDKPIVIPGTTVVYTMTVTNPGNTTLQSVVVTDPQCTAPPVRTAGDTNTNNLLETSETWTYTCSSVINADTTNTVTVTAQDSLGGAKGTVTKTATAFVDVISPAINITKVANPTIIRTGESTTYTITVTNGVSTETITNVVVTDPLCEPVFVSGDDGDAALEEGETWLYTCTTALTADTTNTAMATGTDQLGGPVQDTANAFVEVIDPNINVDKTASPTLIRSGDTVTYTYVVTTTSSDPLSSVTLTDDKLALPCLAAPVITGGNQDALLEAGEAWTYTCTTTLAADTTNLATVVGTDKTNRPVSDTDPASVDVIFPGIDVQKSANPTIIRSGNSVTYTYVVTNTGDTALGLTLDDDKLDALPCLVTPTTKGGPGGDQDASFEPGEIWTFACATAIVSDTTNVVTVTGTPPVGANVTDTASATVDVIAPAINVLKTASANTIHAGDSVTYTYTVTLGGDNTPLTSVTVVDDKCASVTTPTKTVGDTDDVLEAGEVWTYTCSTPITVDTTNIATATGTAPDNGTVTDTDTQTVVVLNPDIAVVKTVNGQDSVIVRSGTPVTYTYSVTNLGDTPLTVSLDDDMLPDLQCLVDHTGDTDGDNKLDPGETWLYTCPGQIVTVDTTNTVTATGVDPLGGDNGTVTDTDTASVDVIDPDIEIDKTTSTPIIREGETASYSYAVSNDGEKRTGPGGGVYTRAGVTGRCGGGGARSLAPPDRWRHRRRARGRRGVAVHLLDPAQRRHHHTATATGHDPNGDPVTDTDTASVDVIDPDIEIDKTTSTPIIREGETASYSYAVSNDGDVPLANVTVSDDKCAPVALVSGDTNANALLDLAETWIFSCSTPLTVDTTNTATATGHDVNGDPVTDTDTEDVDVIDPGIQVDKNTTTPVIRVGGTAAYTYDVSLNGDTPLTNVTLLDDKCASIVGPTKTGGDTDDVLEAGEVWQYTCSTPLTVDTTNTATATGHDPNGDPVTDTDTASVDVIDPGIEVDKNTTTPVIPVGGTAAYTYDVSLNGDTPLTNVTLLDDKCPSIVGPTKTGGDTDDVLEAGEVWQYTCSTPLSVDTTNTATATGHDPNGDPVTDTDTASVDVIDADVAIVKTASVPQVGAGGGFSWILDVTNNGPDPASGVVVGDIVPSSLQITGVTSAQFTCTTTGNNVSCTKASMAVGEKGTVTITVSVPASAVDGTIQNVGTVQSNLPDPNLSNNSDDASVVVVAAQAPTTTLPPVVLPPTGSNSTMRGLQLAAIAVLLGGLAVLGTRRRRPEH